MTASQTIVVHDYAGHPFTAELSRALAKRGWSVHHVLFAGDAGPKGRNAQVEGDPDRLTFHGLNIPGEYSKTDFLKRRRGDIEYGKKLGALIRELKPSLVISGNTPTETQEHLVNACRATDAAFIYWCQDFYSIAASRILEKKLPGIGHIVGSYYTFLERRQMRRADHVIHITEGFRAQTDRWKISNDKVSVIPNWGVIDEIPQLDRNTAWAREQGLGSGARFVYSGTLATKHNPKILSELARAVEGEGEVVVVAAGVGADNLAQEAAGGALPALRLLPLQPFNRFPEVLASADVLVAMIEVEAGEFSVPSKILSYLCAGRPIVLAAPEDNLAAQIVTETNAGRVVPPGDIRSAVDAAKSFAADPDAAREAGAAGRAYAEATFDLKSVAAAFEAIFWPILKKRFGSAGPAP
ncbi:glycosyltransferase [Pseudoroseicyclus sp. H15]